MFSEEEVAEFRAEAEELLDGAERSLLALDKGEPLSGHYDAIFRAFHSIKGAAGMMNLTRLQTHMHHLENIFTSQRTQTCLPKHLTEMFLRGSDAARKILDGQDIDFDFSAASAPPPQSAPQASQNQPAVMASTTGHLGRVFVVDDEVDIVNLLVQIVESANMEAHGFTEARAALAKIDELKPDLVISDIAMPHMDGIQMVNAIRAKSPDLPVIFVSGNVNKQNLLEAIGLGVFTVIEKPFDVGEVIVQCLNAVRKHHLYKLLNSSINIIMYQFSDLDAYLKQQGREDVRRALHNEVETLIRQKRELRVRKPVKTSAA